MLTAQPSLAPEGDRAETPQATGESAMWVYIVGDLFIFGGWFVFYLVYRALDPATFLASQAELSQTQGMINTLILLTSSWFVARCVHAARSGNYGVATTQAWLAFVAGVVFAISKLLEWRAELSAGHTFTKNYFFMFYYFLTGIHMFHVVCGFIVLGVLVRNLRTPSQRSQVVVEDCAAYWHMIDLLWVMIFALLYLLR
jgi:nitric oxide reductase NorE protein